MGSGKPWIRGGEKESALAAPALSGFEGGQGRREVEDLGVEAGAIQFFGGVGKENTIRS
jgi:hypothetical protein